MTNMVHSFVVALFIGLLPISALAQTPRIDPAGIAGAILVCGSGDVSQTALERFVDLAGGDKAKIIMLAAEDDRIMVSLLKALSAAAKKKGAPDPNLVLANGLKDGLGDATGVWLRADSAKNWEAALKKHPIADQLRAVLKRGGVIATAGPGVKLLGAANLDLLPSGFVDAGPPAASEPKLAAGLVGFRIESGGGMLIKQRTISAIDKKATIYVAGNPLRKLLVEGKTQQDLTAVRRAAYDRAHAFPPKNVEPPVVEKGTLVIVGGGGWPKDLHKTFIDFAGGAEKAKIVILPTANPDPLSRDFAGLSAPWLKAGALKVKVLPGRTLAEVESKEYLDTLREATGIWFDGGRQWRFVDAYEDTKALPLLFDVLKRGGVIGGTSAGATIQGDYLARGGVFNNFDIRYEGYERGLGFLKGVAIDQHFSQRKRHADMTSLMKTYPQYLGIGLDEATAIVVKGSVADVIGKGKVHFYDTKRKVADGAEDYEALSAGGRYDLKLRKVLPME